MVKIEEMKGQELLDVQEGENEIRLIYKENRYIIKTVNGKFVFDQY